MILLWHVMRSIILMSANFEAKLALHMPSSLSHISPFKRGFLNPSHWQYGKSLQNSSLSQISWRHNLFLSSPIILKFYTEHGSDTAMLYAKFQNDGADEMGIIEKQVCEIWVSRFFLGEFIYMYCNRPQISSWDVCGNESVFRSNLYAMLLRFSPHY